uniref:Uncharacterized protein n=1 Tax=Thermogemmatispora argillosa TaxID=2045280 RepID=A0A455SZU6_9CHLR|nr:hypothetical protein KTA_13070 [Thermogemmatispora argillosa]
MWEPLIWQAHKSCFPKAGKVLCWPEWAPGLLYSFRVEPTPAREDSKDSPTYAHYRIAGSLLPSPEGLAQILDWSTTPRERLIARLSEPFARPCYTKTIYIQHGQQLYGPIELDSERLGPRAYTDGSSELYVTVCDLPQDEQEILTFLLDNGEELRLLTIEPQACEQQDWSPPSVIIKQVLTASKQLLIEDFKPDEVRRVLKALKHALSSLPPTALSLLPDTLARAKALLHEGEQAISALEQFSDFLQQLPAVQQQLAAAREAAHQRAYQEAQAEARQHLAQFYREQEEAIARELEARLAEQRQQLADGERQLDQLTRAIKEASDELELYKEETEAQKRLLQKQEAQLQAFEARFWQRLEELRQQPLEVLSQVLADHWLLVASASTDNRRGSRRDTSRGMGTGTALQHTTEALWPELANAGPHKSIADPSILLQLDTVRQAAQYNGVKPAAVRFCIIVLLTGLIPTLSGPHALATLEALSQVLSGGRLCRVPIPLNALQPLDLLGQLSTKERLFLPAASPLADTVLWAANHPEQLAIVVLEGLDRIPGAAVYVPLLQQYMAMQHRPTATPTAVPLFHPQVLPPDDPYRSLAAFHWPRNLLLTATCDSDLHSLPLPTITRGWLVHLEPSRLPLSLNQHQLNAPQERGEVAAADWQRWRLSVNQTLAGTASNDTSANAALAVLDLLKQTAQFFGCSFEEGFLNKAAYDLATASAEEVS